MSETPGAPSTGREIITAMLEANIPPRLPIMPITMMFAADYAGKPYRAYATDYRVLAEAQARLAEDFGLDYVSCISDPAREAADCGAVIEYFDEQPPAIVEEHALLADKSALVRLEPPDPLGGGRMHDRVLAAARLKELAGNDKLVEGWVEGPCAMAADLRGINTLMMDFYEDPDFVRSLFSFTVEMESRFARAQIEAGADLIGIGDAAASLIGPELYDTFVWPYEKQLADAIHAQGACVRLHICGNTSPILGGMGKLGCDIVDLDFMVPMDQARAVMGPDQVLLGNLAPVALMRDGTPEAIQAALHTCHEQTKPRYIAGAGCEIPRGTPHENLRALVEAAHVCSELGGHNE